MLFDIVRELEREEWIRRTHHPIQGGIEFAAISLRRSEFADRLNWI